VWQTERCDHENGYKVFFLNSQFKTVCKDESGYITQLKQQKLIADNT